MEFPANTTLLIIVCCHQFRNMEKTGIVKRKINCSTKDEFKEKDSLIS
jgi:hypothetical protein